MNDVQAGIRTLFFELTSYDEWSAGRVWAMFADSGLHVSGVFLLQQSDTLGRWHVRDVARNAEEARWSWNTLKGMPRTEAEAAPKRTYTLDESGMEQFRGDMASLQERPKWRILYVGDEDSLPRIVTDEHMVITPEHTWKTTNWKA